jgi:hypothetical protein
MGDAFNKGVYFRETGYEPHGGQAVIHRDHTRHRVLSNGRRWGKTLLGGKEAETTAFVLNFLGQPMRGWIVGPIYPDCEKEFRVIYDSLKSLGVDGVSSKFLNNVDNGNMHIHTNWGWDLECRSAAHPETLVGEGLDFVLMVEAGRQQRKTWTESIRPALSDKRGWSLHTGVPEGATDTSLLYSLWQRGQDASKPAWRSWRMPSWTNLIVFPGGRQDEEILEAEDELTADEFDRQYGAKFVDRVGRVMKEWDDEVHLADLEYNPAWPVYGAVDYGYTNPFVWLWVQVDEFNNVYVIREKRWTLLDTNDIADDLLESPIDAALLRQCTAFYPDPAEPDDTETLMKKLRIPARSNTGGELKHRLARIRTALKPLPAHAKPEDQQPGLLVDRDCPQLAWEMREGYRWPEKKSEVKNEDEKPVPKNDHGPEALGRFFKGYFDLTGAPSKPRQRKIKMRTAA